MRFRAKKTKTTRTLQILAAFSLMVVLAAAVHSRQQAEKRLPENTVDAGAGSVGPEDAKVTIVEFSDYQCPFCAKAAKAIGNIQEEHPDKVRVVFMDRPLIEKMKDGYAFHPWALTAHEASAEAAAQGEFKKMHVWIFTNQRQIFSMSRPKSREELMAGLQQVREKLVNGAKELGLDHERMRAALEDNRHQAEIMKRVMSAQSLGINGTPAVYVNDMYVGSNLDMVKALVKEYLKKDKE